MKNSSRSSGRPERDRKGGRRGTLRGFFVLAVLAVIAGVAGVGAHAWKRNVPLSAIRVEGNRLVAEEDLLLLAGIPQGGRLFALDASAIRRRLMTHAFIRSAEVQRDVQHGLTLLVTEREPVAALPGEQVLYVDVSGLVLPPLKPARRPDVPLLTGALYARRPAPGGRLTSPPVLAALAVLDTAASAGEDLNRLISEAHVRPDGQLVLYTTEFAIPVLVGTGPVAEKLAGLEAFWNTIVVGRGAADLSSVDLRFDRQVVVRWK